MIDGVVDIDVAGIEVSPPLAEVLASLGLPVTNIRNRFYTVPWVANLMARAHYGLVYDFDRVPDGFEPAARMFYTFYECISER